MSESLATVGNVPLNDRERAVLDFEAASRDRGTVKEERIRATLGMSPARYYQLLGRLIDSLEAQEYDPMLIRRLQRVRERTRAGAARRVFVPGERSVDRFVPGSIGTII